MADNLILSWRERNWSTLQQDFNVLLSQIKNLSYENIKYDNTSLFKQFLEIYGRFVVDLYTTNMIENQKSKSQTQRFQIAPQDFYDKLREKTRSSIQGAHTMARIKSELATETGPAPEGGPERRPSSRNRNPKLRVSTLRGSRGGGRVKRRKKGKSRKSKKRR